MQGALSPVLPSPSCWLLILQLDQGGVWSWAGTWGIVEGPAGPAASSQGAPPSALPHLSHRGCTAPAACTCLQVSCFLQRTPCLSGSPRAQESASPRQQEVAMARGGSIPQDWWVREHPCSKGQTSCTSAFLPAQPGTGCSPEPFSGSETQGTRDALQRGPRCWPRGTGAL